MLNLLWDDSIPPMGTIESKIDLSLIPYPTFTVQPQSQTVNDGDAVIYTAQSSGTTMQWYLNGAVVSGATSNYFAIIANHADNGAQVYCVTKNNYGLSTQSNTATLTVSDGELSLPSFTVQPQSATVDEYGTQTFTIDVDNADSYQWYKNGVAVGDESGPLELTDISATDNGSVIWCKATNSDGSSFSDMATMSVIGKHYRLSGTTYHDCTDYIISQTEDFEVVYDVYVYSATKKVLSGTTWTTITGMIAWNADGTMSTRIKGTEYKSTESIAQTVGWHTVRFMRKFGNYYFRIDDTPYYSMGDFTLNEKFYINYIGRGYGASGWEYCNGIISDVKLYRGGGEGVGTLTLDVSLSNFSGGSTQTARIGDDCTIANYNETFWIDSTRVTPTATDLPTTVSGTSGDVIEVTGVASNGAEYHWFKDGELVSKLNPLQLDVSVEDNGSELYFIAHSADGVVMSNKSTLSVSAFTLQAQALYTFDTLSTVGSVSSFADSSGNGFNITNMDASFDGRTLNGNNALSVSNTGDIHIPDSVFSGLSGVQSIFVVASLNDMRATNTVLTATTEHGELSVIVDALNETLTYKLGTIEIVVNKVMDRDVHVYGVSVGPGELVGYFDNETVIDLSAPSSVSISSLVVAENADSLIGEIIVINDELTDNVKQNLGVL